MDKYEFSEAFWYALGGPFRVAGRVVSAPFRAVGSGCASWAERERRKADLLHEERQQEIQQRSLIRTLKEERQAGWLDEHWAHRGESVQTIRHYRRLLGERELTISEEDSLRLIESYKQDREYLFSTLDQGKEPSFEEWLEIKKKEEKQMKWIMSRMAEEDWRFEA